MPAPLLSKEEVLDRLTSVFRLQGYEGASLKKLSEATGLGRSSLYHYFPGGKEDMAAAVLNHVVKRFDEEVVACLSQPGEPAERLKAMTNALERFYDDGQRPCLLDIFAIGTAGDFFHKEIAVAMDGFQDILGCFLVDQGLDASTAKRRAETALILIQGALVVSRGRGDREILKRTLADLAVGLLAKPEGV